MAELAELKGTVDDQIKEEIKKLPKEQKARAVALNNILNKKKDLDTQLEKEIKALEYKYEQLSQPIYQQSAQLITGQRLPNQEELNNLTEFLNEEEKAQQDTLVDTPDNHKPIEGYWLKVLKNCDQLTNEIHEKDEELLKSLLNIEFIGKELDKQDFSLIFTFAPNDYFTNDKIIKTFLHKEGEEEHYKTEATEINWKEGKNITVKQVKKKQKNKKTGQQRTITKEVEDESFFNFLKPTELQEDQDDEDDEQQQIQLEKMNLEADIAQTLIDEVIPYSLEYYLGIKVEGEEGDFEDEDDDDDIPQQDDEDEDDQPVQKSKKKAVKGQHKASSGSNDKDGPKEGGAQQQAECKQQ